MAAAVAASGALAVALPVSGAFAAAGSGADGSAQNSPGLVSGNGIQLPVQVPVNLCGNTVNVVGLLNPAAGNRCTDTGVSGTGGASASGGASAHGGAQDAPGVVSGNGVQLPVDVPVQISGNSVNVVGVANPVLGNTSVNGPGDQPRAPRHPQTPPAPHTPPTPHTPSAPPAHPAPHPRHTPLHPAEPPRTVTTLAHTGTDLAAPAAAVSAALLLTGGILYRRFRQGGTR
ncbi:chaplin [Streptomyces sp. NPDC127190]|uniref:chaplin n=1 Tax=unclassified Streptomyces TaxID=2593676 RepID=UPI0036422BC4